MLSGVGDPSYLAGMRRLPRLSVLVPSLLGLALAVPTAGAVGPVAADEPGAAPSSAGSAAEAVPGLRVTRPARGLRQPWDVQPIDRGRLLVTERETKRLLVVTDGRARAVRWGADVWAAGETGLMSLEVDPGFASNRRFYTCAGGFPADGGRDVRVTAWKLNGQGTRATRATSLLTGLPASGGRHGGCRLLIAANGALLVGTGDAADERNPQSLTSLGGKTLRMNRFSGRPWPANPFADAANRNQRYVLTYGHRNVQGLAQRNDGSLWSVEHGPSRDDEVNKLVGGANYGWNPGPGYDENRPMTDFSLPGPQLGARWKSGDPTVATSGAAWVRGARWGSLNGTLAVAALKDSSVRFLRFDADGRLQSVRRPAALTRFGRLRSVTNAPNGDLLITTANGTGDSVLRVRPRG
ncbi:PQQ-dependent sugar dehydrogenase [Nocardioides lentus]|uniref:PQQ-dependent sugar dehydrogenase n=2 Tax=Nocardioides lentus TaxID=338077 RepID=A0ABN2PU20_9ACTN